MSWRGTKGRALRCGFIWLLSLMFVASLAAPAGALAGSSDPGTRITINLRATGLEGDIFNLDDFEIMAGEITADGHTLDRRTAMGAVAAYAYAQGINLEIKDWGWGIAIDQIGSDDNNRGSWSYYVNGTSPMSGADSYFLCDGDALHLVNYSLQRYTFALGIDKSAVEAGDTVTVSVQYTDGEGSSAMIEGADIFISDALGGDLNPVAVDTSIGQTGSGGELSFICKQEGAFYPYAEWNGRSSRYQWPTVALEVGKKNLTTDPLAGNWVKNGHTVLDALLKFQQADGSFWWQEDMEGVADGTTAQSLAALADLSYGCSIRHMVGGAVHFNPQVEKLAGAIAKAVGWYRENYVSPDNWEGLAALWAAGEDLSSTPWQPSQNWRCTDPGFAADTTDNEHIHHIFRLLAVGSDPANIWGNRNLFAELAAQQRENGSFGDLSKHIWAIVSLDAGRNLGKEVGSWGAAANRDKAINYLSSQQNQDGSFGDFSQLDFTGWSLIALSNYMGEPGVADVIDGSLAFLKSRQQNNGGFSLPGEWGAENANTNAAVISGLVAVGEDLSIGESAIQVGDLPLSITIPLGAAGARLNTSTTTEGDKKTATLPSMEVEVTLPLGTARLDVFQGTKVSGPGSWNGSIGLPELLANSSVNVSGATVSAVLEMGFWGGQLDFDRPVRLTIPGQAGKRAGFAGDGAAVTEITKKLSEDSLAAAAAELSPGEAGKIDAGADLAIWTSHFSRFVAYTSATADDGSSSGGQSPSSITVSVRIIGKSSAYFSGNVILPGHRANALEALRETGIPFSARENDAYVYEVAGEREDLATSAGWKYKVNGIVPAVPAKSCSISSGDQIIWFWAADAGRDAPGGGNPAKTVAALAPGEMERLKESAFSAQKQLLALLKDGARPMLLQEASNLTIVIGGDRPMDREEKEILQNKLQENIVSIFQNAHPGEDIMISDACGEVLLQVEKGSLAVGTELTVEEVSPGGLPETPNHKFVSPVYRLGPEGTAFAKPVFFSVRLSIPDECPPAELLLAWLDEKSGKWYALPTAVDLTSGCVGAFLHHFSPFVVLALQEAAEPGVPFPVFRDVTPEGFPWAYGAINCLAGLGIIKGVGDGKFEPSRDVTRAEFTVMLAGTLGLAADEGEKGDVSFADVSKSSWYFAAVSAAAQAGIVKGVAENIFLPQKYITREQMAAMLSGASPSAAEPEGTGVSFTDTGDIAPWARESVSKAACSGLIKGFPDGSFRPLEATTRAEAAVVLHRLIKGI